MLGQGVVPVLLLTVHGHVRPICGSGCRGWAPRGSPSCKRAPRVPRTRRKYVEGVERFWWRHEGSSEAKTVTRGAYLARDLSAGSGEMEFVVHASSDWHAVSTFCGSILLGPLQWGFSDRTWCCILPSVGYPVILIPDSGSILQGFSTPAWSAGLRWVYFSHFEGRLWDVFRVLWF
jgi:hypothetical protein